MSVGSGFKIEDASSYDGVAGSFDALTETYSRELAQALARAVRVQERSRVIDVGCGTGLVAFEAARLSGPRTEVVGIDLSQGMLRVAEAKAASSGLADRVSFHRGDAEALDLSDGYADGYVSLYAYRHFPHPERAAAEAFRVLAPGGSVALAVGSAPRLLSRQGIGRLAAAVMRRGRERLGRERAACGHLEGLVRRHVRSVAEVETSRWSDSTRDPSGALERMVAAAGFTEVRRGWIGAEFVVPTTEAFWELQATISTPSRKRMARAAPDELHALKSAFWSDCEAVLARGGRLIYRVGAAMVTARKPG